MILPDINLLVYAVRSDVPEHRRANSWLTEMLNGPRPLALADVILSGFVRIATNRKSYPEALTVDSALDFANDLRRRPRTIMLTPDDHQWDVFEDLCRQASATGNLVPDAYIASLAIANGCELATNDRDFRRFRGLRTFNPLEP